MPGWLLPLAMSAASAAGSYLAGRNKPSSTPQQSPYLKDIYGRLTSQLGQFGEQPGLLSEADLGQQIGFAQRPLSARFTQARKLADVDAVRRGVYRSGMAAGKQGQLRRQEATSLAELAQRMRLQNLLGGQQRQQQLLGLLAQLASGDQARFNMGSAANLASYQNLQNVLGQGGTLALQALLSQYGGGTSDGGIPPGLGTEYVQRPA